MGEVSGETGSRAKGDLRILYFIYVNYQGRGGHYHSLNHISSAIGKHLNIAICSIGKNPSYIIEKNPHFLAHTELSKTNILEFRSKIQSIIKSFKPSIIHYFDRKSYLLIDLIVYPKSIPKLVTKCGGPNPLSYPKVDNLILFSEENKIWFDSNKRFTDSNVVVIPNRVNPEILSSNVHLKLPKKEAFNFVRIARINKVYYKGIKDSIKLIDRLVDHNLNVHLYIIGSIQDVEIAQTLKEEIRSLPITLIHDDEYTKKGSDLLYLADAVIGTGRGFMEATFWGIPVLAPAVNSEYPVLIDNENFGPFFRSNFSQRTYVSKDVLTENLEKIKKMVSDDTYRKSLSSNSKNFFNVYFNIQTKIADYINLYDNIRSDQATNKYHENISHKLKCLLKQLLKTT